MAVIPAGWHACILMQRFVYFIWTLREYRRPSSSESPSRRNPPSEWFSLFQLSHECSSFSAVIRDFYAELLSSKSSCLANTPDCSSSGFLLVPLWWLSHSVIHFLCLDFFFLSSIESLCNLSVIKKWEKRWLCEYTAACDQRLITSVRKRKKRAKQNKKKETDPTEIDYVQSCHFLFLCSSVCFFFSFLYIKKTFVPPIRITNYFFYEQCIQCSSLKPDLSCCDKHWTNVKQIFPLFMQPLITARVSLASFLSVFRSTRG